jgi:hypothetical protein
MYCPVCNLSIAPEDPDAVRLSDTLAFHGRCFDKKYPQKDVPGKLKFIHKYIFKKLEPK